MFLKLTDAINKKRYFNTNHIIWFDDNGKGTTLMLTYGTAVVTETVEEIEQMLKGDKKNDVRNSD